MTNKLEYQHKIIIISILYLIKIKHISVKIQYINQITIMITIMIKLHNGLSQIFKGFHLIFHNQNHQTTTTNNS
jgi:hypothetical protein